MGATMHVHIDFCKKYMYVRIVLVAAWSRRAVQIPRSDSDGDDDLADLLARLDEAVRIGDVVKGEGVGDRGPQRTAG